MKPYAFHTDGVVQNALIIQVFITLFSGVIVELYRPAAGQTSTAEDEFVSEFAGNGMLYTSIFVMLLAGFLIAREAHLDAMDRRAARK